MDLTVYCYVSARLNVRDRRGGRAVGVHFEAFGSEVDFSGTFPLKIVDVPHGVGTGNVQHSTGLSRSSCPVVSQASCSVHDDLTAGDIDV